MARNRTVMVLVSALLFALTLPLATRKVARFFLFPGDRVPAAPAPTDFVAHTLRASDGVIVRAYELPAPGTAKTIVYFHNNRETAESRADLAREIHARGAGFVLVEYRGYGHSQGSEPSEDGLYADATAVLDMLAARGVGPNRIVLWGTSLGTGVAAEMASRGRGAALVLVTPYTSIPDLVSDVARFVPARALVADHFDTQGKAASIRMPTLVIHGDADEVVPAWMGARIAMSIPGATLIRIENGRHGDLFQREGPKLLAAISALLG